MTRVAIRRLVPADLPAYKYLRDGVLTADRAPESFHIRRCT